MQNRYVQWLIYIVLSVVIAPVIVFITGFLMVGDYEGENGFFGFLGSVYGGAFTGNLSAWVVLFAPLGVALIWLLAFWSWRNVPAAARD